MRFPLILLLCFLSCVAARANYDWVYCTGLSPVAADGAYVTACKVTATINFSASVSATNVILYFQQIKDGVVTGTNSFQTYITPGGSISTSVYSSGRNNTTIAFHTYGVKLIKCQQNGGSKTFAVSGDWSGSPTPYASGQTYDGWNSDSNVHTESVQWSVGGNVLTSGTQTGRISFTDTGTHPYSVYLNDGKMVEGTYDGVGSVSWSFSGQLSAGDVVRVCADGKWIDAYTLTANSDGVVTPSVLWSIANSTGSVSTGTSSSSGTTTSLSNYNGTSGTNNTLTRGDIYDSNYTSVYNAIKDLKIDSSYSTLASAVDTSSGTAVMRTSGGGGSTSGTTVVSGSFLTKDQLAAMTSTSSVPDATVVNLDTPDSTYISGTLAAALSATNSISSLDGSQSQLLASGSDAQVSFEGKISSFTNQASAIPTSIGTLSSFDLGEVEIVSGYTKNISIDLTKPYVTMGRGALKAVVSLLFFATVLMTVRRFL